MNRREATENTEGTEDLQLALWIRVSVAWYDAPFRQISVNQRFISVISVQSFLRLTEPIVRVPFPPPRQGSRSVL